MSQHLLASYGDIGISSSVLISTDWMHLVGIIGIISNMVSLLKSYAEVPGISIFCERHCLEWFLLMCKMLLGRSNILALTWIWDLFMKWQSCKLFQGAYSLTSGWSNCSQALITNLWGQPFHWSPPLFVTFGMPFSSLYH